MAYSSLPQLDRAFLTDGGLETDILFNQGIDLPHFASITLFQTSEGRQALHDYYSGYLRLAERTGSGLILESATWRASPDWAAPLGLGGEQLDQLNRDAVDLLLGMREDWRAAIADIVVSGCIGPRGDGYDPGRVMTVGEAEDYHAHQVRVLAHAGVDMLTAMTMTNIPEATGIVRAARNAGCDVAISFTTETDGRLPTGDSLADAVQAVDRDTGAYPAYYMINCAHPTHFAAALTPSEAWTERIRGVRANASRCSHAELDAMTELDTGDPDELAELHARLRQDFPGISILGGCCGTDIRHITAIAAACLEPKDS